MIVLQVNKFFHPRAGAETAFLNTRQLLDERGHTVVDFAMRSEGDIPSPYSDYFAPTRSYGEGGRVRRGRDALASVYSVPARRALRRLLADHRPDVAHLHNVYHQLTLSVVDELASQRVPIVLTMHDWKLACPAYTLFTEGAPCRRCIDGSVANAVKHRCIKGSAAASALGAAEAALARRRDTYGKVQRFVAPSAFAAEVARMGGVEPGRVAVVPNFLTDEELGAPVAEAPADAALLYAGRLDATKGVRELLAAFERVEIPARLRIAGSGELEGEVAAAAARDPRIDFLGRIPREEVAREIAGARAVVLPSIWEDNGPMIILEAQALGRAMIVTDRGGPKEFVGDGETGLVVPAEDVDALATALETLGSNLTLAREMGTRARRSVEERHGAERHYEQLMTVYDAAMAEVQ